MVVSRGVTPAPQPAALVTRSPFPAPEQEGEQIEFWGSLIALGLSLAGEQEDNVLRNV